MTATTSSHSKLSVMTPLRTAFVSPRRFAWVSDAAVTCMRSPIFRDTSSVSNDASVMIPRPPICTRIMIATLPNGDQWVAVSTLASAPQEAPVAVNRAVTKPVC